MSGPAGHASSRKRATATHCSDELLPHGRQRPTHARSPTADPLSRRAGPSTPTADPRPPLGPPTHGLLARPRDGLSARACRTTLPSRRPTLAQRFPWPSAPRDPPTDGGCAKNRRSERAPAERAAWRYSCPDAPRTDGHVPIGAGFRRTNAGKWGPHSSCCRSLIGCHVPTQGRKRFGTSRCRLCSTV